MWWEPTNDFERALRADVDLLLGEYRDYLSTLSSQSEQAIYGVGSQIDENGQWRPVILVDVASVEVGATYLAAELSLPWDDPVHRYLSSARALTHVFEGSASLRELLGSWEIPDDTLISFSTRPSPATVASPQTTTLSAGSVLRSMQQPFAVATAGLNVQYASGSAAQPAVLTVGHLVSSAAARVEVVHPAAPPQAATASPVGLVVSHEDPQQTSPIGGWDLAVVVLDPGVQMMGVQRAGTAMPPSLPSVPLNVTIHGGRSGTVYGVIAGALAQVGDLTRQWLSCWTLAPSGTLVLGDSGSVAVGVNDNRVYGHFVGGSMWPGSTALLHLWIQDLASLLNATAPGVQV